MILTCAAIAAAVILVNALASRFTGWNLERLVARSVDSGAAAPAAGGVS